MSIFRRLAGITVLAGGITLCSLLPSSCATTLGQRELNPEKSAYLSRVEENFLSSLPSENHKEVEVLIDQVYKELEDLTTAEFEKYKAVTSKAFELSKIRNFQRYPLELLEESNKNLTNPDYNQEKPLALFFLATYDYEGLLGIKALEVKPHLIKEFAQGYKVIIFEYQNKEELKQHLKKVSELYPAKENISGLVIAGHGEITTIKSGASEFINAQDMEEIFKPYLDLFKKDATILLSSCNSGNGKENAFNFTNASAGVFLGREVYSCEGTLVDFEYDFTDEHKIAPESLKLYALGPTGWPFKDCTYKAKFDSAQEYDERAPHLMEGYYQNQYGLGIKEIADLSGLAETDLIDNGRLAVLKNGKNIVSITDLFEAFDSRGEKLKQALKEKIVEFYLQ